MGNLGNNKIAGRSFRRRRWVTSNRLYNMCVIASILGVSGPIFLLLLLTRTLPVLSNMYWIISSIREDVLLHYSIRYLITNLCILVVLLVYRSKVKGWIGKFVGWLYVDDQRYPRIVVFCAVLMIIFTFQTKMHLGFWFSGINGWDYSNWHPILERTLPESSYDGGDISSEKFAFLKNAVVAENAIYLPDDGYLTGKAMFLHFRNGEVLPANYELTGFVFPENIFGFRYGQFRARKLFFQVVKASLARRRGNRRFLLPLSVAYPNHTPYMTVNYTTYPPADTLETISIWRLTIYVNGLREVQIVKATEELSIDAE